MTLTKHERDFLAAFIYEATTDPFKGPATDDLHRHGIYYSHIMNLMAAYHGENNPDQEGLGGKRNPNPPPCPWPDREAAILRDIGLAYNLLPREILAKASLRGNEYAWGLADVEEAVAAAQNCGLVTVGGQAQFRVPEGICEMYWIEADATPINEGEAWEAYVRRSGDEVVSKVRQIVAKTDFREEAANFSFLRDRIEQGLPVLDHLCFVLFLRPKVSLGQ